MTFTSCSYCNIILYFPIFASCILEGLNVWNVLTKKFFLLSRCCPWGSIWCWADSTMYKVLWKSTNSQSSSVVTCNSSKVLSSKYIIFFCLDSYTINCYCCSKTFSTVAQKSFQVNNYGLYVSNEWHWKGCGFVSSLLVCIQRNTIQWWCNNFQTPAKKLSTR